MDKPGRWLIALGCLALTSIAMRAADALSAPLAHDGLAEQRPVAQVAQLAQAAPAAPATSTVPRGAPPAAAASGPLRAAIAPIAPFVLPQTATPEGFSIDLWNEIARRLQVEFTWTKFSAQPALLDALQRGDADVAIAAITMTPEREKQVDFSLPYFDSGLQIMVRAQNQSSLLATFWSIPWLATVQLVGIAAAIVFILANLVILIERKRDCAFQKPYWRALGEGIWVTMLIIATGEHGERDAAGLWKRILVPAMWLIGVLLIAH